MTATYRDAGGKTPSDGGLRRLTSQELAHRVLRQRILAGEIVGGTRLIQTDIAQDLQISTTPVREALRELAAEGLVSFDPHQGASVTSIGRDEAREVLWLRTMLEPEGMRLAAARRTDAHLAEAHQIEASMSSEKDQAKWSVLNRAFHTLLSDAAASPWMGQILRNLRSASEICTFASLHVAHEPMVVGNAQHRQLLDAIERRDEDAAATITVDHINAIRTALNLNQKDQ